ncbi:UNVERIFIED_CONTAM: hypothetical protein Slati_1872200 [Sesamum latifolium]|uniref:Uncharacterized protein n=1 Tax=Sesamum latifolium TaxID=2727402 RepID=A0AAW2X1A1_9LAMI
MAAPNVPAVAREDDDNNAPFEPPLLQACYFYTYTWSRQCDKAFIRGLYHQAVRGHRQAGRTPKEI